MITIRMVSSARDLKTFAAFPNRLYRDNPNYVPLLVKEELEVLDQKKNPVFKNADAWYYLAYDNTKVVGRIAVIVNHIELNEQNIQKCRFGWLDFIESDEVLDALLAQLEEKARELGLPLVQGPMGFSNMEKAGLLIEGFDEIGTMITLYNHPYYASMLESRGYTKASEWVEYKFTLPPEIPAKTKKFASIITERYNLKLLNFKSNKEIVPYVDEMFKLLDRTYRKLETYVPIQLWQIEHYKEKYLSFINPAFIKAVVDGDGRMVAFAITMPSFSKALQKAKGNLLPLGWYHLLKAKRKNTKAAMYLIGIDEKYQGKGVTAIMFLEIFNMFKAQGIQVVETNPELEDNKAVQQLWSVYNPTLHKRRRTYKKEIVLSPKPAL